MYRPNSLGWGGGQMDLFSQVSYTPQLSCISGSDLLKQFWQKEILCYKNHNGFSINRLIRFHKKYL